MMLKAQQAPFFVALKVLEPGWTDRTTDRMITVTLSRMHRGLMVSWEHLVIHKNIAVYGDLHVHI